jgi:hypothetical protein
LKVDEPEDALRRACRVNAQCLPERMSVSSAML